MDLNIILWICGTLFSLGIFAVKIGFGLGFGRIKWKGVFLIFSSYLVIFVLIAMFSEWLTRILEPVLRKGPYLHALMAIGMIAWGAYVIRQFGVQKTKNQNQKLQDSSLLLLLPCPVCLTAITFSTWAALNVIQLPAPIVGMGLGISFVTLSLLFFGLTRLKKSANPELSLGLSMMGIGLYFLASLFLPPKIEEAKSVYMSFLTEGIGIALNDSIGVFILLFVTMLIGYFANKRQVIKKRIPKKSEDFWVQR